MHRLKMRLSTFVNLRCIQPEVQVHDGDAFQAAQPCAESSSHRVAVSAIPAASVSRPHASTGMALTVVAIRGNDLPVGEQQTRHGVVVFIEKNAPHGSRIRAQPPFHSPRAYRSLRSCKKRCIAQRNNEDARTPCMDS